MKRVAILLTGVLCLSLSAHAQPEKKPEVPRQPEPPREPTGKNQIDLRPRFEKGKEHSFILNMVSSTHQGPVGGKPAPRTSAPRPGRGGAPVVPDSEPPDTPELSESSSKVELGLKIKAVEVSAERGATVELSIDTVKASIKSGDTNIDFDSTGPAKRGDGDDMAAMLFQSLAGSKMTMNVDREGNITSVTGGEQLAALGQLAGGAGKPGDLFSSIFSVGKASGKAAIGESWENDDRIESPLLGRFRMVTKHTLASARGGEAFIDLHGRIEPASEAAHDTPVTIKSSRHDGHYIWDTGSGMLKQMDSTMSSEVRAKLGEREVLTRSESKLSVVRRK